MAELTEREGKFFWNPIIGKTYPLAFCQDPLSIGCGPKENLEAVYFGIDKESHIFFREVDGRIFRYSAYAAIPTVWIGDCGDDEPVSPAFDAWLDCEIKDPKLKKSILDKLEGLKSKKLEGKV